MSSSDLRMTVRRCCYATFPVSGVLIAGAFYLMPNRKHGAAVFEADVLFQLGFAMAFVAVALSLGATLLLVLGVED